MFDTEELKQIGKLLRANLPVEFANNGHSAEDGLLQMKLKKYANESIIFRGVARVLDGYFQKQGLSVQYCEKNRPMMYLRRKDNHSLKAGISVTMSKKMLVLFFPTT